MDEVLKKVRQLHALLEEKNAQADKQLKNIAEIKEEQEDTDNKQKATADHLNARTRVLKKYEDFDIEKKNLAEAIKRNQELRIENDNVTKAFEKREAGVVGQEKELNESIAIFKKKNARMDDLL